MDFQLNDNPFNSKFAGKTLLTVKQHLDSLEDGKLLNTQTLCDRINLQRSTVLCEIRQLIDYTVKFKNKRVFGNKKTIEEFQKQYGR